MVVVIFTRSSKTAAKAGVALSKTHRKHRHRRPAMIRSAAKNFPRRRYRNVSGDTTRSRPLAKSWRHGFPSTPKWRLARKAFATTAAYDSAIASTLETSQHERKLPCQPAADAFPSTLTSFVPKDTRPALRRKPAPRKQPCIRMAPASGRGQWTPAFRARSFPTTTIVDLQAAWDLAQEFDEPVCTINQAHQPLRNGDGQDSRRGLQESSRV